MVAPTLPVVAAAERQCRSRASSTEEADDTTCPAANAEKCDINARIAKNLSTCVRPCDVRFRARNPRDEMPRGMRHSRDFSRLFARKYQLEGREARIVD